MDADANQSTHFQRCFAQLRRLKIYDDTLIVLAGDHGEPGTGPVGGWVSWQTGTAATIRNREWSPVAVISGISRPNKHYPAGNVELRTRCQ